MTKLIAIIPAAGAGKRLGLGMNKAFAPIAGVPLLVHCLKMVAGTGMVARAVVALAAAELAEGRALLARYQQQCFPDLPYTLVAGGRERQDSVANALDAIADTDAYVAVHDAARPFAGRAVFQRVLAAAEKYGAAIAAVPVKDTIKTLDAEGAVAATPARSSLYLVQTPQIFQLGLLKQAYAYLRLHPAQVTDDASVVELYGHKVASALGTYVNIKITTPEDLLFAENILRKQGRGMAETGRLPQFSIGTGFDVHRLVAGRRLVLCGVTVPYAKGLLGHSDADVALHALMDALLGAAALGDIGRYFPDTDARYKDADSVQLAAQVMLLLQGAGWQVNNADLTIIAQRPKLAGYIPQMRGQLARILAVDESRVNVKATTTEKLGFTGREEGIAAEAVASLIKRQ